MEKKSGGILAYDGKIVGFLNKMGEIILLNIVFLLCCLPIITIGPAMTSFYYATMKSIRMERGYPVKEFFHSMKRTLKKGIILTIAILLWMAVLFLGREYFMAGAEEMTPRELMYDLLILFSNCVLIYVFPVFSRFEKKLTAIVKLAFVMSIRFLPITVLALLGSLAVGWLLIYILPIACFLFVPGLWCLLLTFLIEKALHAYMPKAEPGEENWYDEKQIMRKERRCGNGDNNEAR